MTHLVLSSFFFFSIQLLVAVYYLFSDVLLMGQVVYYRNRYPQAAKEDVLEPTAPNASAWNDQEPVTDDEETPLVGKKKQATPETRRIVRIFKVSSVVFVVGILAGSAYYFFGGDEKADTTHLHLTAQLFGWASALLYCLSRIPQIMQNFRKESVEGLSIFMFVFSVLGNLFYCIVSWKGKIYMKRLAYLLFSPSFLNPPIGRTSSSITHGCSAVVAPCSLILW